MSDSHISPKNFELFLHCSIWIILGINVSEVKEQHIKNEAVGNKFFDIPNIKK